MKQAIEEKKNGFAKKNWKQIDLVLGGSACHHSFANCASISFLGYGAQERDFSMRSKALNPLKASEHAGEGHAIGLGMRPVRKLMRYGGLKKMVVPSSASLAMERGLRVRTKAPRPPSVSERGGGGSSLNGGDEVEEPLSPYSRLFHTPSLDTCLIIIFGFATSLDLDALKIRLKETLIKHPRFSSKLVFDGDREKNPRWVRTKVNLEEHLIVPDLDPNMDKPDRFVEDYASNLSKTPIDVSKPLWEFHILNIKISNADAVGVFKVHHSVGDGMSLVSLVLSMSRKSSNLEELPSIPTSTKKKPKFVDGPFRYLIAIWLIFKLFLNISYQAVLALFVKDTDTPIKGGKGVEHLPKRIVHRLISLDDIKLIKNGTNTTVNDVIVGVTDAALSRYLNRKCGGRLQKNIRLRASVIANVRQTAGLQELAEMMEKGSKCRWGNKVGVFLVPFHISLEEDPLEYVRRVNANLNQKKLLLEATLSYYATWLLLKVFGIKVVAALTHRLLFNSTLMVSNVLGPAEEITCCGQRLAYIAPSGWGLPASMVIHFMSYMNKMSIVVGACEEVIPDPHELCDDMVESVEIMKNAVLQRKAKTGLF
ncbi:Wax ester synthase/diacylglycerol acyltransferase 11-like protein [Drosera capensis]